MPAILRFRTSWQIKAMPGMSVEKSSWKSHQLELGFSVIALLSYILRLPLVNKINRPIVKDKIE